MPLLLLRPFFIHLLVHAGSANPHPPSSIPYSCLTGLTLDHSRQLTPARRWIDPGNGIVNFVWTCAWHSDTLSCVEIAILGRLDMLFNVSPLPHALGKVTFADGSSLEWRSTRGISGAGEI